ncbi:large ribosomal subunit protein eL14 [Phascolarctos cinereus]|uniref:Large ribosomal subunit protein eL14 n=1 Tax=Phascolarctos cinereus TaxID=38626 RepID=A0A6P5KUC5_PHACI|nr:uncharacterized protein C1orf141 homolog isoform X3 [Phascolarctos cinereus]XP_020848727.1 uncharacterized protein C1orf141 homolog isoform X3 [Phascolarctos cinereus]XP_020848728.1 uncharacterized protein C1orf141 homolog isoform X3 [Phascolarctos cinereus]
MVFKCYMEIGWVAYISFGPHAGKLVAIVDVIDQNRALVDGSCSGVRRQAMPFKYRQLTDFMLKFPHSAHQKYVQAAWEKEKISTKWEATRWSKNIETRESKAKMTDFDRCKVMKAKKMRNQIIKHDVKKLQKASTQKWSPKKGAAQKALAAKVSSKKIPSEKAEGQKATPSQKGHKSQKAQAKQGPTQKGPAQKTAAPMAKK